MSDCLLDHLPDNMEDNVGPPPLDIAAAVNFTAPQATEVRASASSVCALDCGPGVRISWLRLLLWLQHRRMLHCSVQVVALPRPALAGQRRWIAKFH